MAYASVDDLLARKDCRMVGQLISDNGVAVPRTQLATNPVIVACLDDASGQVEVACQFAKRYTPADLASLTGNSLAHLKRIVCDVAFYLIYDFRPDNRRGAEFDRAAQVAEGHLERLRQGQTVFDLSAHVDAGLPEVAGVFIDGCNPATNGPPTIAQQTPNFYPVPRWPFYGRGCW